MMTQYECKKLLKLINVRNKKFLSCMLREESCVCVIGLLFLCHAHKV